MVSVISLINNDHYYHQDSPCEELAPPVNGAKACETWMAGIMCTVHCNNGYGFANHPDPVYFCRPTTGEWFHERNNKGKKPSLPDCSSKKMQYESQLSLI